MHQLKESAIFLALGKFGLHDQNFSFISFLNWPIGILKQKLQQADKDSRE